MNAVKRHNRIQHNYVTIVNHYAIFMGPFIQVNIYIITLVIT